MAFQVLLHSWVVPEDTISGVTTQWLVDAGDNDDTIAITNAAQRSSVLGGSELTASTSPLFQGYVEGGVGNDTIKVTDEGVTSASLSWCW